MLTDPTEIKIISKARQKNVRSHRRSRQHFTNIFEDFFLDLPMQGARLLDLGPGHFRSRGSTTVIFCSKQASPEEFR